MARTSSIFYLAQQNKLNDSLNNTISLFSLASEKTNVSRFFNERLQRVKQDVETARTVCTNLQSLCKILCITPNDITNTEPLTLFKQIRKILKFRMNLEVCPPGNPTSFSLEQSFRITPCYNLNKDPDIVTAKEFNNSQKMTKFLLHRMQQAQLKINNFLILLHVFQSIHLVVNESRLTGEQGSIINSFIEKNIFPAEGKAYLQACFTQAMESNILENELLEPKCFIKPIQNEAVLDRYIKLLAEIAAAAYQKPDFTSFTNADKLNEYYNIYQSNNKIKNNFTISVPQSTKNKSNQETKFYFLEEFSHSFEKAYEELLQSKDLLNSINFEPQTKESDVITNNITQSKDISDKEFFVQNYRKYILYLTKNREFYNPKELVFKANNSTIYINDVAVTNANMYSTTNKENVFWRFALNNNHIPYLYPAEGCKTFLELDNDARKKFAIALNNPSSYFHLSDVMGMSLAANLEYRLLFEGVIGTISQQEKSNAFMWLVQWYNQFFIANDKVMYDFSKTLTYMGNIIAIYCFLFKDEITPNLEQILKFHPFTTDYALLQISQALKTNTLNDLDLNTKINYYFNIFINSSSTFNLNMRVNSLNAILLREEAFKLFKNKIKETPDLIKKIEKHLTISQKFEFNSPFSALKYYKNTIFNCFVGEIIKIPSIPQITAIIDNIKNELAPLLSYIQGGGNNVRNELVYRILEHNLQGKNNFSASITNFRQMLLATEIFAYDELKHLFNININSRKQVLQIILKCAQILKLNMYPDPNVENYDYTVSAFDFISFKPQTLIEKDTDNNNEVFTYPKEINRIILPYRLAIDAATSYSIQEQLYRVFVDNINSNTKCSTTEKENIATYAQLITAIKQQKGGNCRVGLGLKQVTFNEQELKELYAYFAIVSSSIDKSWVNRNIKAINAKLNQKNLDIFISDKTVTPNERSKHFTSFLDFLPNKPTSKELDMELIKVKTAETNEVQQILAPIFEEKDSNNITENEPIKENLPNIKEKVISSDTTTVESVTKSADNSSIASENNNDSESIFAELPLACQKLLKRLLQLPEFTKEDFHKLCKEEKLMPNATIEQINDWAYAHFDCSLLEEDDIMFFDRELLMDAL